MVCSVQVRPQVGGAYPVALDPNARNRHDETTGQLGCPTSGEGISNSNPNLPESDGLVLRCFLNRVLQIFIGSQVLITVLGWNVGTSMVSEIN